MLGKSCSELAERIGRFQKSFLTPETDSMVKEISEFLTHNLLNALEAFLNEDIACSKKIYDEVQEKKYQIQPLPSIISDEPYTDEPTWFLAQLLSGLLDRAEQLCYLTDLMARGVTAVQEYLSKSFLDVE